MSRYKLTIEYEGTRYHGWQVQKNARTVQGEILEALQRILRTDQLELYGAGRTDAGVHALAQVAHLEAAARLAPAELLVQLNQELPADIAIVRAERADARFHARHHALSRYYLYQVAHRKSAFSKRFSWWVKAPLDLAAMAAAASLFQGLRDFQSYVDRRAGEISSQTRIDTIAIVGTGDLTLLRFGGTHFLWRMVRRMVGVIVEAGRGGLSAGQIESFFDQRSEEPGRLTAPAAGLFLERVLYPGDPPPDDPVPALWPGRCHQNP